MERTRPLKYLLLATMMLSYVLVSAQSNRYVIYFPDKTNSIFSVDAPEEFLSDRAILRRSNQGISITEQDFPVNSWYLDSLEDYGADVYYTSRWFNLALVQSAPSVIDNISDKSFVHEVEFVAPGTRLSEDPDPKNTTYENIDPESVTRTSDVQLQLIGAQGMHQDGYNGEGIWIAIFDGGFDGSNTSSVFSHIFLESKLMDIEDFTTGGGNVFQYDDHGTNVFSCVGSFYDETLVGTGYNAEFSLYVTEDVDTEYRVEEYNWLFAAEKADSSGVDIITSSLGYNTFDDMTMDYTYSQLDGNSAVITRAANMAAERGILVISSAGNEGNGSWKYVTTPADGDRVLAVGGVNDENLVVSFSSRGPTADDRIKPDVVALGSSVAVLHGSGNIGFNSGTSFATPLIAGFAASLWQANPALTNFELMDFIKSSGDSFHKPDTLRGFCLPSYNSAIVKILSIDDILLDKIKVYPNPFSGKYVYVQIGKGFESNRIEFAIHDANGKLIGRKTVRKTLPGDVIQLKVNTFENGVYFLTVNTPQKSKQVKLLKY